jgi:uncharacterized protein (DUF2147 family)
MKVALTGLFATSLILMTGAADAASFLDTIIANVRSHLDNRQVAHSSFTRKTHRAGVKERGDAYETSSAKSTLLDVNSSVASAAAFASPVGQWIVDDDDRRVQITACGKALCGFISSAKPDAVDRYNPDATRRNRSVLNVPVLINMTPTDTNRWEGQIYNTRDGKTYSGKILMRSANLLEVEGNAPHALLLQTWVKDGD